MKLALIALSLSVLANMSMAYPAYKSIRRDIIEYSMETDEAQEIQARRDYKNNEKLAELVSFTLPGGKK